jgi:exosortase/archaeosortase family protein
MHLAKTIPPLFWRGIVFLLIFIAASGVIGPRIISGGILFRDGFALYGGFGKALIFGCIAFALLARHNKTITKIQPWRPALLGWIIISVFAFAIAWAAIGNLLADQRDFASLALAHGSLVIGLALAGIGCMGLENLQTLWHAYRDVIIRSTIIAGVFYMFLQLVYMLWQPLASTVLISVNYLLNLTGLHAVVVPPHTLMFDKFGITVAEYCSGIESIALFTGLYVIVGLLDWQRINKQRYYLIFPFALLGLFAVNILRVFGLIMAGYHINPEIAFSLFHTYAGMVFFIIYSGVFWSFSYKYLINKMQGGNTPMKKVLLG